MKLWRKHGSNKLLVTKDKKLIICDTCPCSITGGDERFITINNFFCCTTSISARFPRTLYAHFAPSYCGITTIRFSFVATTILPGGIVIVTWRNNSVPCTLGIGSAQLSAFNEAFPDIVHRCAMRIDLERPPPVSGDYAIFVPHYPVISSGPEWNCDLVGTAPLPFTGGPFTPLECDSSVPVSTPITILIDENP